MSTPAIIMMIVAMVVVWGGLAAAIISISRHDAKGQVDFNRDL